MEPLDTHYLELQFMQRTYSLSGTEFQSFVEGILAKKYEDFKRVRPYGNRGDGGNDGFRRGNGIYYQIYAPLDSAVKDGEAATKMRADFEKLFEKWNHLTEIREFNFVFNDRFRGTNIVIEEEMASLEEDYPAVNFQLILSSTLQNLFLSLDEASLISLHFNIDKLKAHQIASSILESAAIEMDKENTDLAYKLLSNSEKPVMGLLDPGIQIQHTILMARCFQQSEEFEKSDSVLSQLVTDNKNSTEALLAAAEIKILMGDYNENLMFLEAAEKIDGQSSQVILNKLVRKVNLNEPFEIEKLGRNAFSSDTRKLSSYYRLASISSFQRKDLSQAMHFIEKAISLNNERIENHRFQLELLTIEARDIEDRSKRNVELAKILRKIDDLVEDFRGKEFLKTRTKVYLNRLRADIYLILGDEVSFVKVASEIIQDCQKCYLDKGIEFILEFILSGGMIDAKALKDICAYIRKSNRKIGPELSKALVVQFNYNDILSDVGMQFFQRIGQDENVEFISKYGDRDFDYLLDEFNQDPKFGLMFIDSIGKFSDDIGELIDQLQIEDFNKLRLKFHLYCASKDFESAFEIVKMLDVQALGGFEIEEMLRVANKFDAYDIELSLLNRFLEVRDGKVPLNFKIRHFDTLLRSKKYPDAINVGIELLKLGGDDEFLAKNNRTNIFNNVLFACHKRGKIDEEYIDKAIEIIDVFGQPCADSNSKIIYIPQILISNKKFGEAFESIVMAVVESKGLSANEYAKLFWPVCIQIGDHLDLDDFKSDEVQNKSFVYLEESDQWYRIGDEEPLDAISVNTNSLKYDEFKGARIGSQVKISPQFGLATKTETVTNILTEAGYVHEKIRKSFANLADKDLVPGVRAVQIRGVDGEIDKKHLVETVKLVTRTDDTLFEMYQSGPVPFAFLATNQGNFANGLGKILNEEKGYINFSSGDLKDFDSQVTSAKHILSDDSLLYIDGTSAVFLAEFGLFDRVINCLTNVKIPQTVVSLLANLAETFKPQSENLGGLPPSWIA